MDQILRTHVIEPVTLRADDFDAFFIAREEALLRRIEVAMGKPIAREMIVPEAGLAVEYQDEELVEAT